MILRTSTWRVCIALGPFLAGCGPTEQEPISASTLALTAQENVAHALRGAHAAGSFIAESATLAELLSAPSEQDCPPTGFTPCPPGTVCPAPEQPVCRDSVTSEDLQESRQEMSDAIDDLVQMLGEEVFVPENLESEDTASATYRLPTDMLCGSDGEDGPLPGSAYPETTPFAPAPMNELDPDCVEQAAKLQPRLRLTSPSDGSVDVALLLTPSKRNPITLRVGTESVSLVVDLGEIKASLDAAGYEMENLVAMSGKVSSELRRNAELDYSFRLNVLSNLSVTQRDDLGQETRVSLTESSPSFELKLDGNAHRVTAAYDFGSLAVHGPLNAFRDTFDDQEEFDAVGDPLPQKTYAGLIDLLVGGLEGNLVLDGDQDTLNFSGLGLGEVSSTLKHDGTLLGKLDLNPGSGRHFDLRLARNVDDTTTIGISPTFDLTFLANFAPLQGQIEDLPNYLLGDTSRIWLEGQNPSLRGEPEQLRVLTGTLNLTSSRNPEANLVVMPGACLRESEASSPSHELLGSLVAGDCR